MPPTTFDCGGKVVLVTGVGRVGQIGNAVALAFGRAGAKIVACDVNAVGVSERVRTMVDPTLFEPAGGPAVEGAESRTASFAAN
jgi:NAD(P)-dependent dehydrogenase (short-subunit alcohol dehydrogenase family)